MQRTKNLCSFCHEYQIFIPVMNICHEYQNLTSIFHFCHFCHKYQNLNQKEKFWKGQGRVEGDENDREKAERGMGGGEGGCTSGAPLPSWYESYLMRRRM